ncbi:MAG: hypothetical protein HFI23_15090 [Lachnospiraceae bacterium]|nr:hypothetical protein [Lachnospiraceae bacterium]
MRKITVLTSIIMILIGAFTANSIDTYAAEEKEILTGKTYELGKKDEYEINKAEEVSDKASRFYLSGNISDVSTKNGFVSYAVDSGNLKVMVDKEFGTALFTPKKEQDWHIITDKTKIVDGTKLTEDIGSGAVIVQTSKDGKIWVNVDTEADIYNKMDTLNKRTINGEQINAFYETTNVQITAGCYYRIIVVYKLERTVEPSKVLFVEIKNTEQKERMEIYEFYAYNSNVNQLKELDTTDAYEFSDVYRVDSQDGFKNPTEIKSDDPHNDWTLGKFYISGYTDVVYDDIPVFLKVPGDKAALWFNLEHTLDKCNGRTDIKVEYISSGSDIYFGTPTIDDFGRGALIIRKTDKNNKKERYIYTNYLEASAAVGANTRVDLFEEGDYEVALDYQLHYDKPFVFGTTTTKTLTYRVFFKFKVRNGDISAFIRDIDTNQFITNANVTENGFYIDIANSQYLSLSIKREVLSEGLDGLIEDTKFSGVAKEGRYYTEEGIYTVTVENLATGDSVEKRVYVGDSDILKTHMITGISISEINERLATGAVIDENGYISDYVSETNEEDIKTESEETTEIESGTEEISDAEKDTEKIDKVVNDEQQKNKNDGWILPAVIAILVVLGITLVLRKKKKNNTDKKEADAE